MRTIIASRGRGWSRTWGGVVFAVLAALAASEAVAAECDEKGGDAFVVAALVVDARTACPCGSFASRQEFRDCVRTVVDDAIAGTSLPKRCRGAAMRFARRSSCGAGPSKVVCCKAGGGCSVAASEARCAEQGGGTGQVGGTESCYDACVPAPTPSPRVTPTPFAPCCACGCRPPYYEGCSGTHQCSAPLPGATSPEECDALDDEWKDCIHAFIACGQSSGGIPYPICN